MTNGINVYLNNHKRVSSMLLIITSLEVDMLTLFIFIQSIFSKSARLVIGLFLLMLLRELCQTLVLLPLPAGLIWYYPHFPTLFITYEIINDFFFSGHTALIIYAAISIGQLFKDYKYIGLLKWLIIVFQCVVVLFLRIHYFMDVFAALFTAIVVYQFAQKIKLPYWLDLEKVTSNKKLQNS